jgi:hypothetical protein
MQTMENNTNANTQQPKVLQILETPEDLNLILLSIDDTRIFDRMIEKIKASLNGNKLTNANIGTLVILTMKTIETYREFSGSKKKAIVLYIIQKVAHDQYNDYVKTANLSEEESKELQDIIAFTELFLPVMIDTMISIDRKEITIKLKKSFTSCLK